jgi:hypothetical protein
LAGHTDADQANTFAAGVDNYTYWNAGIAVSVRNFSFDFRYWDTNIANDDQANQRVVFGTTIVLP